MYDQLCTVCLYVGMYVCIYVYMYVCVCMYVCTRDCSLNSNSNTLEPSSTLSPPVSQCTTFPTSKHLACILKCYYFSYIFCFLKLHKLRSKNIEVKIYRTIIVLVVVYACESWSLTLRNVG
jgi:hypothetical protein